MKQLAGGRVETDRDVVTGAIAGRLDRGDQQLEWRLVRAQTGREATLVTDSSGQPALRERDFELVVDLGADLQRVSKRSGPYRRNHELLEVDRIVRVHPAVEDVHRRDGEQVSVIAAEIPPQRLARRRGGGTSCGHRYAQQSIGAQA